MTRILVTGGAGFIGSHFIDLLVESELGEVVCFDAFTYAADERNLAAVADRIEIVRGDIRRPEDLRPVFERGVDWVVNFAAETHVDTSIDSPLLFVRTNVLGTLRLLMFARHYGVERFLQVSTDEVYGSRIEGAFEEGDPHHPSSPYAAAKSGADQLCNAWLVTYGLPVISARSTNNYGPRQHREKFLPVCISCALAGRPIPIFGSGLQQRDWIYVRDNVEALLLVLQQGRPGEVFNVGAGKHLTNIELAGRILALCGAPPNLIEHVEDRPGHDFRYAVDTSRITALGWRPRTPLDEGLRRTVEWYRQRLTPCT